MYKRQGVDCASITELMLAKAVGFEGDDIMFSSNMTPAEDYMYARKLGAIINLDDITHIEFLKNNGGIPEKICLRYNPGGELHIGNTCMGHPWDAKYGMTRPQIFQAIRMLQSEGVKQFGLQMCIRDRHKAAKGALGLFPDAKAVEQRRLSAVEDDARGKGRRQRPRRLPQGVKQGVIIRAHAFDILAEHVAHGAVDEAAVAVQQRRRGDVFAALLDGRPKPAEGLEVGAQRLRARALGGGANNDAVAKRSRQ